MMAHLFCFVWHQVELVFYTTVPPMRREDEGRQKFQKEDPVLSISLAKLDIPINHLFVALYLPESEYNYISFKGMTESLRMTRMKLAQLGGFGDDPSATWSDLDTRNKSNRRLERSPSFAQKAPRTLVRRPSLTNCSLDSASVSDDDDETCATSPLLFRTNALHGDGGLNNVVTSMDSNDQTSDNTNSNVKKGIRPVTVDLPRVGKPVYFEQLLCVDTQNVIHIHYEHIPSQAAAHRKSFWGPRISWFCCA